jgi:mgtE-like transporter
MNFYRVGLFYKKTKWMKVTIMSAFKIFKEVTGSMMLSAIGVMVAGLILGNMVSYVKLIPGLIVLIPAMLNMRGCIASALAARLGTAIHMGIVGWQPNHEAREELKQNIYASLVLTVITSAIIGLLADITCRILNLPTVGPVMLAIIAIIGGGLAGIFMISLTCFIAMYSAKRGMDPDNVTIPLLTTLGDIITISCVFATVILIG